MLVDSGSHDGVMHSPAGRRVIQQSSDSTNYPEKIREGRYAFTVKNIMYQTLFTLYYSLEMYMCMTLKVWHAKYCMRFHQTFI